MPAKKKRVYAIVIAISAIITLTISVKIARATHYFGWADNFIVGTLRAVSQHYPYISEVEAHSQMQSAAVWGCPVGAQNASTPGNAVTQVGYYMGDHNSSNCVSFLAQLRRYRTGGEPACPELYSSSNCQPFYSDGIKTIQRTTCGWPAGDWWTTMDWEPLKLPHQFWIYDHGFYVFFDTFFAAGPDYEYASHHGCYSIKWI